MGVELVTIPAHLCPACGAEVELVVFAEPGLVRHGGYGATRRTVIRLCRSPGCDWSLVSSVDETRPD